MNVPGTTYRSPRDSQRSKVYAAEQATSMCRAGAEPDLRSMKDLAEFVNGRIVGSSYWRRSHPKVKAVIVADGRGRSAAGGSYYRRRITMPLWSRSRLIVCHELAHVVTDPEEPAHGWAFCAEYLRLVERFIGRAEAEELRASFKAHGVKYLAPRAKRQISPEEYQVLRERLSAARARKIDPSSQSRKDTP